MFPTGIEPVTLCVWSTRDNHYTTETQILFSEKIKIKNINDVT